MYNSFLVYCRELAPGTVSLTGDWAQGDDSKHDSHYSKRHSNKHYNSNHYNIVNMVGYFNKCTLVMVGMVMSITTHYIQIRHVMKTFVCKPFQFLICKLRS